MGRENACVVCLMIVCGEGVGNQQGGLPHMGQFRKAGRPGTGNDHIRCGVRGSHGGTEFNDVYMGHVRRQLADARKVPGAGDDEKVAQVCALPGGFNDQGIQIPSPLGTAHYQGHAAVPGQVELRPGFVFVFPGHHFLAYRSAGDNAFGGIEVVPGFLNAQQHVRAAFGGHAVGLSGQRVGIVHVGADSLAVGGVNGRE